MAWRLRRQAEVDVLEGEDRGHSGEPDRLPREGIQPDAPGLGRTARVRRDGMAMALFIAPWGFVIANALYLWTTLHGGDDLTSRNALALAAAHPLADRLGILAAMLGSLLFVPAVLGAMRLVRVRAAWLGLIGGVLMIAAYICYLGLVFQSLTTNAMARQGGPVSAYVAVLDAVSNEPLTAWVGPLFIFGNIVGTFLLGLALLRARAVPAWAAYAVMAWSVLHVVGIAFGSEGFEVTGAILQGVGPRRRRHPSAAPAAAPETNKPVRSPRRATRTCRIALGRLRPGPCRIPHSTLERRTRLAATEGAARLTAHGPEAAFIFGARGKTAYHGGRRARDVAEAQVADCDTASAWSASETEMVTTDFDETVERSHRALGEIVKGNPEGYKTMYSRRDDVSLANPFGGVARGRAEVEERLDRAASNFRDGKTTGFETLVKSVGPDFAYLIEIERYTTKLGGGEDLSNVTLRVTSIFRREEEGWKLVHRQADTRVAPQAAESLVEGSPHSERKAA